MSGTGKSTVFSELAKQGFQVVETDDAPWSDIATWATNRLRVGGLIYAVNGVAKEFSDCGDGSQTDANLTMSDDGADLSVECVRAVAP